MSDTVKEYLIIGGTSWQVQANFGEAYRQWRSRARIDKDTVVNIFEVDTTHIETADRFAPVWLDAMGYIRWDWKESADKDTPKPLRLVYDGPLAKAPKSEKTLAKLL
jgi:hypothetical protein